MSIAEAIRVEANLLERVEQSRMVRRGVNNRTKIVESSRALRNQIGKDPVQILLSVCAVLLPKSLRFAFKSR